MLDRKGWICSRKVPKMDAKAAVIDIQGVKATTCIDYTVTTIDGINVLGNLV